MDSGPVDSTTFRLKPIYIGYKEEHLIIENTSFNQEHNAIYLDTKMLNHLMRFILKYRGSKICHEAIQIIEEN